MEDSNDKPELDERPLEAVPYKDVVRKQDATIAACERNGISIPDDVLRRMRYIDDVLHYGNQGQKSNPTINLPIPYALADLEAVIGTPDDSEPGSDAAWRKIRRSFDASGRTR